MSPDIFMEGQLFTVEVKDSRRNSAERNKTDAEIYSVVTEIVAVDRNIAANPSLHSPNHESLNQESKITQSHNQAINQSGWPAHGQRWQRSARFA
ncbi:MAG TPA: hypothetical protein VFB79_01345 [Candidatus Angelobacter sp.]|nr:hypothetical protein [Candidatus Angelobacter sp.]